MAIVKEKTEKGTTIFKSKKKNRIAEKEESGKTRHGIVRK